MKKQQSIIPQLDKLEKALGGNLDLVTFFVCWMKNERNATAAYQELHPHVSKVSAQVLGSQVLARIDRKAIMKAYGLDEDLYYSQLFEGSKAMKTDSFSGEKLPDHKTRFPYHEKLGKILGIDAEKPTVTNNILIMPSEVMGKYEVESKDK